MKYFFFITILILLNGCSSTNKIYWCGDHPCTSNIERKEYFKNTMIVEIKNLDEKKKFDKSELELIKKQVFKNEKKKIANKKKLKKEKKIKEKKLKKEAKKIKKQNTKKSKKSENNVIQSDGLATIKIEESDFEKLIEKINKKNMFKDYPNINNIE